MLGQTRLAGWLVGLVFGIEMLAGGLTGCSREQLTISDAWIPEAPPGVAALAGYMTIENGSGENRTLVGASGAHFERVEIHQTVYEKDTGLARMIPKNRISIAPGERFLFAPGGYHLMLVGPKKAQQDGEIVHLILEFEDGSRPRVEFEVRRDRLRL